MIKNGYNIYILSLRFLYCIIPFIVKHYRNSLHCIKGECRDFVTGAEIAKLIPTNTLFYQMGSCIDFVSKIVICGTEI
jgi:hypothetical protein